MDPNCEALADCKAFYLIPIAPIGPFDWPSNLLVWSFGTLCSRMVLFILSEYLNSIMMLS